jgi:hypothetical protein
VVFAAPTVLKPVPPLAVATTPVKVDVGMVGDAVTWLAPLAYIYPVKEDIIGATESVIIPLKIEVPFTCNFWPVSVVVPIKRLPVLFNLIASPAVIEPVGVTSNCKYVALEVFVKVSPATMFIIPVLAAAN